MALSEEGPIWHLEEISENTVFVTDIQDGYIFGHGDLNPKTGPHTTRFKIAAKTGELIARNCSKAMKSTNAKITFKELQFGVFADYHMIYLGDTLLFTGDYEDVFNFDFELMMDNPSRHNLRFYTASDRNVTVSITVLRQRPVELKTLGWDIVSEGSIECPSKTLSIEGTTGYFPTAPKFDVHADQVRVRVHSANMTYQDCALDYYLLEIWPEQFSQPTLLFRNKEYINHCVE